MCKTKPLDDGDGVLRCENVFASGCNGVSEQSGCACILSLFLSPSPLPSVYYCVCVCLQICLPNISSICVCICRLLCNQIDDESVAKRM